MTSRPLSLRRNSAVLVLIVGLVAIITSFTPIEGDAVSSSSSSNSFELTLTDGRSSVRPGDTVIFVLTAKNSSAASNEASITLELPGEADQISADKGGVVSGQKVRWDRVLLSQNQSIAFTIQVTYKSPIAEGTFLTAVASSGASEATDVTIAQTNPSAQSSGFIVSVSDGKATVKQGQALRYTVQVTNNSLTARTNDVIVTASEFTDVHSFNPPASNDSNIIVWKDVAFAQGEVKVFTFDATVQPRLTNYLSIKTSASVGSVVATDYTTVTDSASSSSSSQRSTSSRPATDTGKKILFSKTSDVEEVLPGGIIHYTLFVQNILLTVIDDAYIIDRFDPSAVQVTDRGGATLTSDGSLRWNVPTLGPGETWQQSYALLVHPSYDGRSIQNTASIGGSDVAYHALDERVRVVHTGVMPELPPTGAANDLLYSLAILAPAGLFTAAQKKLARK